MKKKPFLKKKHTHKNLLPSKFYCFHHPWKYISYQKFEKSNCFQVTYSFQKIDIKKFTTVFSSFLLFSFIFPRLIDALRIQKNLKNTIGFDRHLFQTHLQPLDPLSLFTMLVLTLLSHVKALSICIYLSDLLECRRRSYRYTEVKCRTSWCIVWSYRFLCTWPPICCDLDYVIWPGDQVKT